MKSDFKISRLDLVAPYLCKSKENRIEKIIQYIFIAVAVILLIVSIHIEIVR